MCSICYTLVIQYTSKSEYISWHQTVYFNLCVSFVLYIRFREVYSTYTIKSFVNISAFFLEERGIIGNIYWVLNIFECNEGMNV